LFDNYKEFEEIIRSKNDDEIDLDDVEINPTLLLLLEIYAKNNKKHLLNRDASCVYIELPEYKFLQQDRGFIDEVMKKLDVQYGGNFVLRHILSELTYNIHEHAFEDNCKIDAAIAIKHYKNSEKLDISIIDNGLSIT
jgi:hypothetical protein